MALDQHLGLKVNSGEVNIGCHTYNNSDALHRNLTDQITLQEP